MTPLDDTLCPVPSGGRLPIPDPTALTTAALHREVAILSETFDRRLEAMDRDAISLNRERTEQFSALKALMGERIDGLTRLVEERFASAERQRLEQKNDTKAAVDAALTAQKEAVREQTIASDKAISKSELATGKQLEQQRESTTTEVAGLRRSIDDLKERIVEVATAANGVVQQRVGAKDDRTALYAAIGFGISVVLFLMVLAGFLATRPGA